MKHGLARYLAPFCAHACSQIFCPKWHLPWAHANRLPRFRASFSTRVVNGHGLAIATVQATNPNFPFYGYGLPGVDDNLQEFAEGCPQFGTNFRFRIAENFLVVCKNDSVFAVLLLSIHVKTNGIKTTGVRSSDLKISGWK
jgi:hypothetical protein